MKQGNTLRRYSGWVFSVGGARAAGLLISSLTFPYLVRHLGVEMYGLWSYVVAIRTFLDIVADPGITTYATQQVAARRREGFDLVADCLLLRALFSVLSLVSLLTIAFLEHRPEVRFLLRFYGIGILFTNLLNADAFLLALEMFHVRALLNVTQQSLYAVGIFLLIRSPRDIIWLPLSVLASSALVGIAGWVVLARDGYKVRPIFQPRRWKQILVPGFHYAASTLMVNIYHRTGTVLVRWLLGDFALGLYAAATRLLDLLRGFLVVLQQVLMPRMALQAKSAANLGRLAEFSVGVTALASFPLAAGMFGTAHLVGPWVLGPNFIAAVPLLRWMSPYLVTAPAASLFAGTILYSQGRHRAFLASTAGGAVAGMILYLILIPVMGLVGAGIALVLAELVVAGIALYLLPQLRGSWKNRAVGWSAGASLLMLLAITIVNSRVSRILPVVGTGILVYAGSCGWLVRSMLNRQVDAISSL